MTQLLVKIHFPGQIQIKIVRLARQHLEIYRKHFGYFDQGDEDQEIRCRIWGYLDEKRKRPFQLFHFYFETVYYTTEFTRDAKGNITGTRQVKHEVPHHRYGMFVAMP